MGMKCRNYNAEIWNVNAQFMVVSFAVFWETGEGACLEGNWELRICLDFDLGKRMNINFLSIESGSNLGSIEETGFGLEK